MGGLAITYEPTDFRAPRDHVIQLVRNCREKVSLVVCQPPLDNVSCIFFPTKYPELGGLLREHHRLMLVLLREHHRLMLVIFGSERDD